MLQKFIDDLRETAGSALRLTSLAAAVALCLFITVCFLCAAAFVFVLERYGLLEACFAGAGVFFVATLVAAVCYALRKREIRRKQAQAAKSSMQAALTDPMTLAVGLQIVRTVGVRRMLPLLAIGGIALGLLANSRRPPADPPE
jgi:hypothetical protein